MTSTQVSKREAVSLMWLVKLSEFAIERELRELPGTHKRRARASRESVIGGQQGQGGHVVVRDDRVVAPEAIGRVDGEASLFGIHVTEPATEET